MARRPTWILNGTSQGDVDDSDPDCAWRLMRELGGVRLMTGPGGTELRWVVTAPNVQSLLAAGELLQHLDGPYMLRFFAAGWFEERFSIPGEVRERIQSLVMHADRHIASRVFVREPEPGSASMPAALREVYAEQSVARDLMVECCYEPEVDGFVVSHIGRHSAIGRIWGTAPSSFPCLSTGAFGQSASRSYGRAVRACAPLYEQVVAALRFPDHTLNWVPYHRVILPVDTGARRQSVQVVCEYADVDFRVL